MFRLEKACNLAHQNSRPKIASSVANSVSQVSKGMFRSEQAWNLAQQDSRSQRTTTIANLIQGVPTSLNVKQTWGIPSKSQLPASFPSRLSTLPNVSPFLPSFSQPPPSIAPNQSYSHNGHSSSLFESQFQNGVSLGDSSKYANNKSLTNVCSSQQINDDCSADEDDEVASSLKNSIEIVDANGDCKLKHNMKVKDVYKLQEGEKVVVHVNECGQPIEDARRVLTRWMTKLVKQPNLCPPDVKDFHELKEICGCHLLRLVREKFSFPNHDNVDRVLLSMFDAKFRNNKYKITKKLYKDAEAILKKKNLSKICIILAIPKKLLIKL
ncbi:unnamed protein product [Amaranthus hypochondriacus]